MGKYKEKEWYIKASKELIEKYEDIPPPWVYGPNMHPYSIGWRMGGGESHVMILGEWLEQEELSFDDRVNYLKKYPAPPRWYLWIIHFLWDVDTDVLEDAECTPYLKQLAELGFAGTKDFSEDFEREDLD